DGADMPQSASGCPLTYRGAVFACGVHEASLDVFGSVRGRLGYAFDNVLAYGTGGWAWGAATHNITCTGGGCPDGAAQPAMRFSSSPNGWAAGGGVEWSFLPSWSLRAEYLHLQYDEAKTDGDIARLGLSYRFSWF